jgi:hypothetical protein
VSFVVSILLLAMDAEKEQPNVLLRFYGLYHHELAHGAFVHELDAAGDFRKEGVVFPAAYVEAGFYAGAALADDDGTAGDDLSAECFKA